MNNQSVRSLRALKKKIHCEYLTADALHLFQKDPDFRRRFLDRLAERLINGYESDLKKCERLLKQKNKLLKTNPTKDMIYILNQQIAEVAVKIVEKRIRVLSKLTETLEKLCGDLDFLSEYSLDLNYEKKRLECNFDTYHDKLLKQFNDDYTKECLCGYSLVGPQRDDFTVRINGKESFNYFSRGINRILAVLLYYTYMILVDEAFESVGILLLDDALAECDFHNRKKLIQYMEKKVQLIYVSTSKDDQCLFENVTSFEVKNGEVAYG